MSRNEMTVVQQVCMTIAGDDFQAKIGQALPPGVTVDRFTRVALTTLQQNPKLCEADRMSLYNAVVRAAQDGLMPDGREGAIVAFGDKAQWMPMVAGIIKRLAQSGISIDAQVVCANDVFERELGDEAKIVHRPPRLGEDRGDIIGAYAIARLPNGLVMREVMDKADIELVRSASRARNGDLWSKWYGEACRKTVIRRLAKRLPLLDPSVAETLQRDDEDYTFVNQPDSQPALPGPSDAPIVEVQKPSPKAGSKAAAKVLDAAAQPQPSPPEGGDF